MDIGKKMAGFAGKSIASRDLSAGAFPHDIWESMRSDGLLNTCNSYNEISMTGMELVLHGGNLGIALSWILQQLAGKVVFEKLGTKFHGKMLAGGKTVCLAISEPETGAHPKHMKTHAEKTPDGYFVTGEKAYITNAPIADLFVVIAVTSEHGGKKDFSAFVIPKGARGIRVEDMNIPFVKPSPHGRIFLEKCSVPETSLIGSEGRAYEQIVLPFREIEDVCMMGAMSGAMLHILRGFCSGGIFPETQGDQIKLDLGRMKAICDTAIILARHACNILDEGNTESLLPLVLVLRSNASEFHMLGIKHADKISSADSGVETMLSDFGMIIKIADKVAQIKQSKLGERVLKGS